MQNQSALVGAANIAVPFVASGDLSGFDAEKKSNEEMNSKRRYFAYQQQQQEKVTIET